MVEVVVVVLVVVVAEVDPFVVVGVDEVVAGGVEAGGEPDEGVGAA